MIELFTKVLVYGLQPVVSFVVALAVGDNFTTTFLTESSEHPLPLVTKSVTANVPESGYNEEALAVDAVLPLPKFQL